MTVDLAFGLFVYGLGRHRHSSALAVLYMGQTIWRYVDEIKIIILRLSIQYRDSLCVM